MSDLWIVSYIALWLIIAGLVVVVTGLLRQLGLIQMRLGVDPGVLITQEGLERGTEAPDFEAIAVHNHHPIHLSEFRGHRVILVFLSPTCLGCREIVPHLNEVAREERGKAEILTVCYGSEVVCGEFAGRLRLNPLMVADPTNAIAMHYSVHGTPFAFLIDEKGIILIRGVVNSWPHLEALLSEEGTFQGERLWQPVTKQPVPDANQNINKPLGILPPKVMKPSRSTELVDAREENEHG